MTAEDAALQARPAGMAETAVLDAPGDLAIVAHPAEAALEDVSHCHLVGTDAHLEAKLGIKTGESTPDGKFYLKREEECLAACCGAPMMMVDHHYYEHLTPEKVDEVLETLE
jgi:hypothetical protein